MKRYACYNVHPVHFLYARLTCWPAQVKVLRAIPPIEPEDTLLGQYVAANEKPGYLDDPTVPKDSTCPTFAATTLWIHNPRWEGIPFILRAGKGISPMLSNAQPVNTIHSLQP
jgi:glucose-6-phosphate 1-dehydrogenase